MAKQTNSTFHITKLSAEEAAARIGARGKRRSKYSQVGDQFAPLQNGEAIVFEASKNEVQGVRNYMRRNFEDTFKLRSRSLGNDQFEIQIIRLDD
jgi:hypothetical protein